MILTQRRSLSTWIERWWIIEPRSRDLIRNVGTQGKGIKFGTTIGIGIGIRAKRDGD